MMWVMTMKYSAGFTKWIPTVLTFGFALASLLFLSLSLKSFQIGTAYSIWTGIGSIGAVMVGILFFNEPRSASRLLFIFLIIIGVLGLKFTTME